ncbi:hypothetical protein D5086_016398 [Populus alba]|uniref:Uncharacterized protein n=1 Tax=Populus alba TaxID=43335 RepID=A0ACC4BVN5_POPAL
MTWQRCGTEWRGGGATGKREMASVTSNEPNIHYSSFISYAVSLRAKTTVDRVEDGAADGIECAVHNGFGGGRDFLGDWCFCFLTKRCGYNVDDLFLAEAAAL